MSTQKNKEYSIGLDIGTSSTGYAITNMDGELLKHKGHSTFGAVLFDEAQTAEERRRYRSTRRRLDRREHRIDLLQDLLSEEVSKVDPVFFIHLNESFLQEDDRKYPLLYGNLPYVEISRQLHISPSAARQANFCVIQTIREEIRRDGE